MVVDFRVSLSGESGCGKRRRDWVVAFLRGVPRLGSLSLLAALAVLGGCAPKVSVGEWQCSAGGGASDGGASADPAPTDPVAVPWSTGFEEGFCDFMRVSGYCYGDEPHVLVTEPHHQGRFAAEFKVVGGQLNQTRCVRQGALPESAYYGAWYFIPEALKEVKSAWNLWHFQGLDDPDDVQDLWDVTLARGAQPGDWELVVYDPLSPPPNNTYRSADRRPVPIGRWFHIELFLKRAADASGEIRLYQDRVLLLEHTGLRSDASKYTQWYVGNWAENATPPDSSLYVDDMSISATLSSASATQ
jgi:hypothetical protein